MKTHYELLEVPADADTEQVKRAFRREIARYHPDKVQHLGVEFQEIAAVRAAELTQAYKTLSDVLLRAEYDALLDIGIKSSRPEPAASPQPAPPVSVEKKPPRPAPATGPSLPEDAGVADFIRRAAVLRFRTALVGEFGRFEEIVAPGFEVTCVPKPAFWSFAFPPRVLGRVVPTVDAAALRETWGLASRLKKDRQRDLCVFLMGPAVAPVGELARVIFDQQRKLPSAAGRLVMVPVNTHDWSAHVPNDAPPAVKSLLARLRV